MNINIKNIFKKNHTKEKGTFLYPSKILRFLMEAFLKFALAVLKIHNCIFFGLKVTGQHNLDGISGGAITICNHMNMLDSTMIACHLNGRRVYFSTLQSNFKIPVAGFLVKYLGGIPIPETVSGYRVFIHRVKTLLNRGSFVHFFPEGELIPYDAKLRDFRRGAFVFAYNCNVPIIPMIITYRKKDGIRRIFRRKPSLNLEIFPPVYPDTNNPRKEEVSRLMGYCKGLMEGKLAN